MKLHFDDCYADERLSYQKDAIEVVCYLFGGQEICRSSLPSSLMKQNNSIE